MKAVIREFLSPDIDLDTFWPDDVEDTGFLLQMLVGPEDGPGEESFDVMVCTLRWLQRRVAEWGPLAGRHYLIIHEYDIGVVKQFLRKQVEDRVFSDWSEVGLKIGRIGHWEFEDYSP